MVDGVRRRLLVYQYIKRLFYKVEHGRGVPGARAEEARCEVPFVYWLY